MNKLEIINFALVGKLAVNKIDTYDSDTAQGRVVRAVYPTILEAAIESFDWAFARTESDALAAIDDTEDGLERYTMPNGVEMILKVFDDDGREFAYRQEGNTLVLTEENKGDNRTIHVRYVKLKDEGTFPAYFGKAVAIDLAASVCMALTENGTLRTALEDEAGKTYRKARRLSTQSGGHRRLAPQSEYTMINQRRG